MNINPNALSDWYSTAKKGERFTYYRGLIAMDRDRTTAKKAELCPEVNFVADFAWNMAARGVVSLIQKRVAPRQFDYMVEKR